MRQLPSGTVTFLFTDVEGSTRLLDDLGAEAYGEALAEHRRVIREACAAEGGVEVDTQGDAFFFAFPTAPSALGAAGALTRALADGSIRVRVGVHTGTPVVTEEGYVGRDVHRAARIAAAGHGGQVLVSAATAALIDGDLRDLGEHRFKDLAAPERVYQLGDGSFPPLKSLYRTNLPIPANPLVGREKELVDIRRLFLREDARVVTLTGPGGIGKTRFALAAAGEVSQQFPDGVWFVDLTPLRDPALVLPTIAHAVAPEGGDLARDLGDAKCLILLDNFEQVVEAGPEVAALLAHCPQLAVLVTSRESLRIAAEREYALRPLPESPAVELFRQRAAAVEPDLEIEERTASAICTKLDRLPLAIELAAARVKVLTPEALLERLDQRLPLLVSRARDVPERQRTLHSTIAWSYELLSGEEQQLFRRFAVFAGGATLESLADIAEADSELVESIVDKSLLRRRGARFVMLETIREFALELFEASDDAEAIRRRHARFFLATAENTNLNAAKLDVRKEMRHDIALAEQDNIRAALEWSLASGAVALGLELAAWIEWFWIMHDAREGMRWFEALFEHPEADTVPPRVRADALRAYGSSTDIAGQDQVAERLYRESLGLFEQLGDEHGRAVLLHRLGIQAMRRGELQRARELVEASHEIHERREDRWGQCQTVGTLGAIARDAADDATASALIGQSREIAREVGVPWWESGMLAELACLSLYGGRFEDAEVQARESLALAEQLHDRPGRVFGVGLLAGVAAERGDLQRAGRLWGAIEEEDAVAPLGGWRRHRASIEARLRAPADDRFERARDAGRDLSLDEAVEYALAES